MWNSIFAAASKERSVAIGRSNFCQMRAICVCDSEIRDLRSLLRNDKVFLAAHHLVKERLRQHK